nr:glycerol-3-phosphate phosphatase-like [Cherax quadricarinatus]
MCITLPNATSVLGSRETSSLARCISLKDRWVSGKDHILSAPYIVAQYLKEINFTKKVYLVGSPGLAQEIQKVGIQCIGVGPERIEGSIYNAMAHSSTLGLDPNVGAVVVGFDREFNYDKLVRATSYLADPDCLFLATNLDEKYKVTGTRYHLPGEAADSLSSHAS